MSKAQKRLEEARQYVARLNAGLPAQIDLLGLSSKYKTAAKAHLLRECLVWRVEELGRNAIKCFDAKDWVAGNLLARAAIETTAMLVYIFDLMERSIETKSAEGVDDKLTASLVGSRVWGDFPTAINVLTMIDKMDKLIPGVRETYDMMSEVAHPNWSGVQGAYAITDHKEFMVSFQRGGRESPNFAEMIVPPFAGTLGLFIHFYEKMGDLLEPFAQVCDAFYESAQNSRPL